jgi:hypothetical protein
VQLECPSNPSVRGRKILPQAFHHELFLISHRSAKEGDSRVLQTCNRINQSRVEFSSLVVTVDIGGRYNVGELRQALLAEFAPELVSRQRLHFAKLFCNNSRRRNLARAKVAASAVPTGDFSNVILEFLLSLFDCSFIRRCELTHLGLNLINGRPKSAGGFRFLSNDLGVEGRIFSFLLLNCDHKVTLLLFEVHFKVS